MNLLRIFRCGRKEVSVSLLLVLIVEVMGTTLLTSLIGVGWAEAAVVTIDSTATSAERSYNSTGAQTVFTTDQIGYAFYRDSTGQCVYRKTTDAGANWGSTVLVDSQTDCIRITVWYDQWTPGDTGSQIHILTMDTSEDDLFYNRLDTTSDTLLNGSTAANVSASSGQVPTFSVAINTHTITKGTDGVLYAAANDNSDSYAISCSASCGSGSNWTEVGTSPFDNRNDHNILVPLNGGDVMVINRDVSANVIRTKVWDGSVWDTSWVVVDTSLTESVEYDGGMSAAVSLTSGNIYLAYATDNDVLTDSNDDVQTAVYDGSAWTTMADVITNVSGRGLLDVAIAIDQNNDDVYVAYTIQDTGGTSNTASIYYKESTNGMTSWGGEQGPINTTPGDIRKPALDPSNFERLYVTWWEASVDDQFGETLDNIGPDTRVSATGTQVSTINADVSQVYVGGTFVVDSLVPNTLSAITITETGTINASTSLANVRLLYELDTTAPYTCDDVSYNGTEAQFGATSTTGFSAADGETTFSGTLVSLNPTQTFCGYVVLDTSVSALDGSTIELEINDPANDVVITGSDPFPGTPVALPGTTTIVSPEVTQTHYHWRADDGSETAATSLTGGIEDTPLVALGKFTPARVRLGVSVEGSTTSSPLQLQLEYAELAGTCSASTGWVGVANATDAFAMFDSPNLTDGADTTDVSPGLGGVTNENTVLLTPNGGVQDVGDITGSVTLATNNFVELEYSIVATSSALEGTTYCFRVTNNGSPIGVYAEYPQVTISADITASSSGSHRASVDIPTEQTYLGGIFSLQANLSSQTVTDITITETGTINASSSLANVRLLYDLDSTAPYTCDDVAYSGDETQFGATSTSGFSAPNGTSTFSGSLSLTTTQTACLYVVADVTASANSGDTIQYSIDSATDDIVAGGASVSPSSAVTISSSTTAVAAVPTQTNYHWRDDDGSETGASSLTGGSENTAVTEFQIDTPVRLRLAVSNEGATSTAANSYTLQYGEQVSTCAAVGTWTDVNNTADDAWDEFDSPNLTDGSNTTDIPIGDGGVVNPNDDFVGLSGVSEGGVSASTTLSDTEFIEIEFVLTSTLATNNDTTYCFRVVTDGTPLPQYSIYPELTMAAKRDFKTQRGNVVISGGTSATITAGVDYDPPASSSAAFIRITNTHHTGAGDIVGGGAQDVEEVTAYIENPSNLGTSITFTRDQNLNETFIDWEIVEFIGQPGTDNEMIVRAADTATLNSISLTEQGSSVSVSDDDDVVVFITGASGDDSANDFYSTQVTAEWDSVADEPVFTREATGGSAVTVSYAVVEFTGMNWQVQRVEHTYTAVGTPETQSITPVTSLTQAFLHTQKRVGANTQVASHGHEVYLSSIGQVSFALPSDASLAVDQVSVAWVIENLQTGVGAMQVERQSGATIAGAEPLTLSLTISSPVNAVNNASIFGNSAARGTNNAHPRSIAALRMTGVNSYQLWRSDTGSELLYRTEIVEWPIANLAYRQNYYRIYTDNNLLTPDDPWPAGPADLGENTSITDADNPPGIGEVLRLRMSVQARNANWPADFAQFKLQFAERMTTCSAAGSWSDVGGVSSSTIWRGFAATGTTDGTAVSSDPPTPGDLVISVSDVAGTLEHENNTASNTYLAFDGEDVEYDWYVEHNGATADTAYCFRMVEADGSILSGYLQYPVIRTADFTPVVQDWRWYGDPENETPSAPEASVNSAPIDITSSSTFALRVVVPESKSVPASDVKFRLQYSTEADFSTVNDVAASSTCTNNDIWCYVDGAVADNATITTAVIGTGDTCVAGSGDGCGTHNSAGTFVPGHTHPAAAAQEYSFTLQSTLLRPNVVYYFRLYDLTRARPVGIASSSTDPSLVSDGAGLTFTVSGLPSGTSTAGITTSATTTPTAVNFGTLPVGSDVAVAQRLTVDTNAVDGYRVWKYASQNLTNSSGIEIPPVTGTNASPGSWSTVCSVIATGCIGYHTTDATLASGSTRFAPTDTYSALHESPEEIMYSSLPASESQDIIYRVRANADQPAGTYETDVVYIVSPVY